MSEQLHGASRRSGQEPPTVPAVRIPDHELIRLIGEGSYGEVWLARNTLGTFRAVKVVHEKTFRHKKPFEREFNGVKKFEPISRLHDGLMDVLHVGRDDNAGYFYCVMELADDVVSGQAIDPNNYSPRTLTHDLAKHKRLPVSECRRIGVAIGSALEFLHGHRLVHRDVKPSNIVFVNGGPKLADIGLVAEATEARSYVGTEGFIPPEGPGTVRSDIYSFGKVLYEISTGKDRHEFPEFPTELGDTIEPGPLFDLNRIVLKACRANPLNRYASAAEMVKDLRNPGKAAGGAGRGLSVAWKAAAGVAILAGALGLMTRMHRPPEKPGGALPGLVSWWSADGSARDGKGENHGIIPGDGSVTYGPGVFGQAFVFDGFHRDGVNVGRSPSLHSRNFTVEAWIKRASATNATRETPDAGASIFGFGHLGYHLGLHKDGRPALSRIDDTAIYATNTISDTNWHHLAVTRNGRSVAFYIDGGPDLMIPVYDADFQFDSAAAIGTRGDWVGSTFYGSIDEVAVYQRALSSAEIETLYRAGSEAARPPPVAPSADGLIAAWLAEGDANDAVGTHPGVLMSGVTFAPGKTGKAFHFDGKSQYVKIPWSPDLDVGRELTIEFWMKADSGNFMHSFQGLVAASFYVIDISSGYNRRTGVNFGISTDGGKTFSPDSYPDIAEANQGGMPVTAAQWHHLAGTYDGIRLQLYVDGRPAGKPMFHPGVISSMTTNSFLAFGGEDGRLAQTGNIMRENGGRFFQGLLDEIRLYRRALSPGEIRFIYEAGASGQPVVFAQRSP